MYNIKSMTLDKYEMSFRVDFRMRKWVPEIPSTMSPNSGD